MSDHSERHGQDEPVIDLSTKLKQYERKRVQIKRNIPELYSEVKKRLPESCQLVDDHADLVIVAWLQQSRVECDAKQAIKFAEIKEGDKDKTILVMFYRPSKDIKNDSYTCKDVHYTFHEPINSLQPSDPPRVTPPNYVRQHKQVQIKGNIPSQVEIDATKAIKSAGIKDGLPWRETRPFKEEAEHLRNELSVYRTTELKITLVGHTGAGKSSLINSIFAISKGRMTNKTLVKSDFVEGVGTHYFTAVTAGKDDLFKAISFFDTMGFHPLSSDMGICDDDLKACLDGRLNEGHRFNEDKILTKALNRPHCVLVVVSADVLNQQSQSHNKKLKEVITSVPEDVARIVVITKVDTVCPASGKNFEFIYKSKEVEGLVKKAQAILGVQENHVFPIINFVCEMNFNEEKSVPIMFLLKFAFDFAQDTKDKYTNKNNSF